MIRPITIILALAVAIWLMCEAVAPQGENFNKPWREEVVWTWTPLFETPAHAKAALESMGARGTFVIKPVFRVEVLKRINRTQIKADLHGKDKRRMQ